ncbi:MAG: SOS response-associated peptidase [Acetobacteraceae bacterium]|nr:SOS response-associated peptidase [Acetobacteraceae bacterium]
MSCASIRRRAHATSIPCAGGSCRAGRRTPRSAARLINARAETLAAKPAFRDAYRKRRCLVPIDAFYEWYAPPGARAKQPYAVALASGEPMALAGLWEGWRAPDGTILRTFTVVTTDANPRLALLHDRMPVVVAPEDWPLWLGEEEGDPARVLKPFPAEAFAVWPVSTRVNGVKANDASLLDPLPGVPPIPGLAEAHGPPPGLSVAAPP